MAEPVEELFAEYAAAYARRVRPHVHEFLARAGERRDELANLIDAFLARAPAPAPDEQAVALFEAWRAGESPLRRLRTSRGVTKDALVAVLVRALGIDEKKKEKVERYYEELESGSLQPARVDRRVWDLLAETLGARVSDLAVWRQHALRGAPFTAASAAQPMTAAMRMDEPKKELEDDVDRLFLSG